ncbi:hypothetical protein SADUNF_Sadunf16G0291300 [Salix dunnii]|uniref:Uncharacterized protein n=1 Tax=Salix dunnii TaxID=1413687 RepID=A0A835MKD0_9ROSI|nr:hypothetical protein SADUNF_Sadunf16G0291300 [Salix dunnii]
MRAICQFARDHSDMYETWQELLLWDSMKRSDIGITSTEVSNRCLLSSRKLFIFRKIHRTKFTCRSLIIHVSEGNILALQGEEMTAKEAKKPAFPIFGTGNSTREVLLELMLSL